MTSERDTTREEPEEVGVAEGEAPREEAPREEAPAEEAPREGGEPWWRSVVRWAAVATAVALAFALGLSVGGGGSDVEEAPGGAHEHGEGGEQGAEVWTCSMHPQIQSPEPGACPICGMDLIPLADGGGEEALAPDQVRLTERAKALARIQTTRVRPLVGERAELRLLGMLEIDETRTHTVTPWTGGRIERQLVATTGQRVRRGQVVARLYSPEVYAAHRDLIQAKAQQERLGEATPLAKRAAAGTLEAVRNRLRLLGVTELELERMERARSPWKQIPIRSAFSGTVLERLVDEGQYVTAGSGLYRLVELDQLWVQLDAYERDLPHLEVGDPVALTVEALPGERFEGVIAFIDPVVDRQTRTAQVRVEVANAEGRLRPGMFAEAVVRRGGDLEEAAPPLIIPESAPLFSGERSLVYVEVPGAEAPTYEAREVKLGGRRGDVYPVLEGLEYGERVVTHGAFRIDADLQLRGGESLMTRSGAQEEGESAPEAVEVTEASREALATLMAAYLDAQEAFARDDLGSAQGHAGRLMATAEGLELEPAAAEALWVGMRGEVLAHGRVLLAAEEIGEARLAFEAVTERLVVLLRAVGNPMEGAVRVAYCPMAFGNRGAVWIQRDEEVRNAYFGSSMLGCGEFRGVLAAGERLGGRAEEAPEATPSSAPSSAPAP